MLIDNFKLVDAGTYREAAMMEVLASALHPARNPEQNIADLRAQLAANEKGVQELHKMVRQFGLDTVLAYMGHVHITEEFVRRVIDVLTDGEFTYLMDNGQQVSVKVSITVKTALRWWISPAPAGAEQLQRPVCGLPRGGAGVFRTLVDDDIPMNEGRLKPVTIILPDDCMLQAQYPAADHGNVETSQIVTDTLYGALGVMAAAQGTMNNFIYGNDVYQYYDSGGGSGAGPDFDGCDAVHTYMTNSRLTDPEVLEWRYPVLLESFEIRDDPAAQAGIAVAMVCAGVPASWNRWRR